MSKQPEPTEEADRPEVGVIFHVTSNFGHRTQKPFVMVTVQEKEFTVNMSPNEARNLAMNLLMCADASESDAFLITFLRKKVLANDKALAPHPWWVAILQDFRDWREENAEE